MMTTRTADFKLKKATRADLPIVMSFIREFADYIERPDEVTATREKLEKDLFGDAVKARVLLGYYNEEPVGFALYCFTYSSFQACPELYLEDLYVKPHMRGCGLGKTILSHLANTAVKNGCRRFRWLVLKEDAAALGFYASVGAAQNTESIPHDVTGKSLHDLAQCL